MVRAKVIDDCDDVQDEVNQELSEQNEVHGIKKGAIQCII